MVFKCNWLLKYWLREYESNFGRKIHLQNWMWNTLLSRGMIFLELQLRHNFFKISPDISPIVGAILSIRGWNCLVSVAVHEKPYVYKKQKKKKRF